MIFSLHSGTIPPVLNPNRVHPWHPLDTPELTGLPESIRDFRHGMIRIARQLVQPQRKGESFRLEPLKNNKPRTLTPAPFVMHVLHEHRAKQQNAGHGAEAMRLESAGRMQRFVVGVMPPKQSGAPW